MKLFFVLAAGCLLLASCNPECLSGEIPVSFRNTAFCVEVADTPEQRAIGLMNRTLEPKAGMLFVFPDSDIRSFWMKDTRIPLAIIFVDENKTVLEVQMAEPCLQEECPLYVSARPARYVLEISPSFASELGIAAGEALDFTYP